MQLWVSWIGTPGTTDKGQSFRLKLEREKRKQAETIIILYKALELVGLLPPPEQWTRTPVQTEKKIREKQDNEKHTIQGVGT
jgi:hypothetical protein